ncbi:HD domain-containing phosphohydrolase [Cryptosporangium sp. NPDC051539]|uniref:HD domain-containing phosphohydrolase n=1 Tax=Cryptosporangium sp. NPDC051539 TaxID=3363962 RepID=UPI003794BAD3
MPRILMVDDEPRVLDGVRRNLAQHYTLQVALSGDEALTILDHNRHATDPFAVVISDMMMPHMNGAQFLAKAHEITPDAVLMILSGQADLPSTIAAVNHSNLFRFIGKPCSPHALRTAIDDALRQYQLLHTERELLHHTLAGAVDVLTQLLSLGNPDAYSRARHTSKLVDTAAKTLLLDHLWELRTAAKLSQIGLVALPPTLVDRVENTPDATDAERAAYATHPQAAHDLLARIPRLERVARWIALQNTDGGQPGDDDQESRCIDVLAVATKFTTARKNTTETPDTTARRLTGTCRHRPDVLTAVHHAALAAARTPTDEDTSTIAIRDLRIGMTFLDDVCTLTGATLVRRGDPVTEALRIRLTKFADTVGIREPVRVTETDGETDTD